MNVSMVTWSRRLGLRLGTPILPMAVRLVVVLMLYVALTAFVFKDVIDNIGTVLLGPPEDNLQDLWNTWYSAVQVHGLADFLSTRLIRYPQGTELFYHSFAYPKILLIALLGPIVATSPSTLVSFQNALLLVSFPLAALGGFYLVRHFTRDDIGAFAGGAMFGFNPSHVEQSLHHMHVESIEFLPFFALFFIIATDRKSAFLLCVSVLFYVLSALSCWYYVFYAGYFMVFYVVFQAVADRRWPTLWESGSVVAHGAVLVLVASPLLVPMISSAVSGMNVNLPGTEYFGADLLEYVSFPQHHLLSAITAGVRSRMAGNEWEGATYLGLVNLALLAWYFTRGWTGQWRLRLFLLSGMAVFAVFASGSWLLILGHRLIPMPDWLLMKLPLFRNVRTPSRAIVFVHLFLAIGIGLAIIAARRAMPRDWRGAATMTSLVALLAVDWYPAKLDTTPFSCPAGYRVITADQGSDFGVLDLPIDQYLDWNGSMALQACHGRPIVSGVVSRELTPTLRDQLIINDAVEQRRQLEGSRVKYIVIHARDGVQFTWRDKTNGPLADYLAAYPTVYSGPDSTVLQVFQ